MKATKRIYFCIQKIGLKLLFACTILVVLSLSFHITLKTRVYSFFLCLCAPKVCYVTNRASRTSLQHIVASSILNKKYLKNHNGGTQNIKATKNFLYNSSILLWEKVIKVKVARVIQREGQFCSVGTKNILYRIQLQIQYRQGNQFCQLFMTGGWKAGVEK